ncbi:TIGR02530 family flagellar biosynthesis protein [Pseudobacteroides cellulosolvens]|uniref:Flagellar operon protein n=1 Tax=Pseudobacteroides cellulosolvens ATCC 35603 = DSM 2933 TaxID=398512 RepID=A0A0L6JRA2_9FIRM|nr:TIGR02530 family flagellar biosynthesis protein [Pseudobacteroides cellulosolvens]KNY28376.1 flagellar operon protein [Pseudobacteroides cellulosolvens ATCC 35603 = DSM 2933]
MVVNNNYFNNIGRINGGQNQQRSNPVKEKTGAVNDFGAILKDKITENEGLKFSKHAEQRLQSRNIKLTEIQKEKMSEAVNKAGMKGVKDSLVIVDNMAFVVNVKSKTVITAVNNSELKENVFTNIDGAVFA